MNGKQKEWPQGGPSCPECRDFPFFCYLLRLSLGTQLQDHTVGLEACVAFSSVSNDWMLMCEGHIQMDEGGPCLHGASKLIVFRLVATVKCIEGETGSTWWCRCRASLEPIVWESCFHRNNDTAKGQRNLYFPPVLNTVISVLQRKDIQLALCICGFCIPGYNQP